MVRNAYQSIGGEYEIQLKSFGRENEMFKKSVRMDRKAGGLSVTSGARNYVAAFMLCSRFIGGFYQCICINYIFSLIFKRCLLTTFGA